MGARVVNSALRRLHERKQYRLFVFRVVVDAALVLFALAAFGATATLFSIMSTL